ncbi:MAG TPA: LytTR family DNA-binding domain-containing protein [Bryobacteraceae bacterium]|jgi:two-component system LytT family response regulator
MIKVLIVDDEPIIRRGLRSHLSNRDCYEVVGECCNGRRAIDDIREAKPDLVFLDVQMPEVDGFGVIREVGPAAMPAVVFVTAFDEYAVRAFDVNALDYLLKPFDEERFSRCLTRVEQRLAEPGKGDSLVEKLASLVAEQAKPRTADRLAIRNSDRITLLQTEEIDWIEAADNYVEIHVGKQVHLMRETLSNLEQRLQPFRFLRIHRSRLVNADRIKELHPLFHGEYELVLSDGTHLTSSRHYRDVLQRLLV